MAEKHLAHLKMSQMDWKKNPTDYIKRPTQDKGMTVSPTLKLYPAVQQALKKIDAIGFDISTKSKAQLLLRFLADKTIMGAIQDMSPQEYEQVFSQQVKGTPPPAAPPGPPEPTNPEVQMSIGDATNGAPKQSMRKLFAQYTNDEMSELLGLLMDVGFEVDNPRYAQMVLEQLSQSNSPSAPLAGHMMQLTTNPALWEELATQAGANMGPSDFGPGGPVVEKELFPNELNDGGGAPAAEEMETIEPELEPAPTPPRGTPAIQPPAAPPPAAPVTTALPPQAPPAAPAAPAPSMAPMPTKTQGQGAQATSKQLQETVNKFEELKKAIPAGVKPLGWGDNSGVRIKTKDGRGGDVAKGGMLLKNYATTEDGILVGVSPGNRLYVRVPPELGTAEWDPAKEDIRISMHDKKWKPEGY